MDVNEIIQLMKAVSDYSLTSFELKEGDVKLSLKREKEVTQIVSAAPAVYPVQGTLEGTVVAVPNADVAPEVVQTPSRAANIGSDQVVTSPLVGTFYNAASPESEPFVKVGDHVKKGQVLGIIEAMKLMNEIESEYDGAVEAILVRNEEVVEYGQPMFRIQ